MAKITIVNRREDPSELSRFFPSNIEHSWLFIIAIVIGVIGIVTILY